MIGKFESFGNAHTEMYKLSETSGKDSVKSEVCMNYWNNVFARKETWRDMPDEKFFSEIFDKDESEFSFDFEMTDELTDIMEVLTPEIWGQLDESDRLEVLTRYGDAIADGLKIEDKPKIILHDGREGEYGCFNPDTNAIYVNRLYIDDVYEIRDTIAHETRHAYQHMRADKLETYDDKCYQVNFKYYLTPGVLNDGSYISFLDYQDQLVEAEACAFAKMFV